MGRSDENWGILGKSGGKCGKLKESGENWRKVGGGGKSKEKWLKEVKSGK